MIWVVFFVAMGIPLWGLAFFEYFTYLARKRAELDQKLREAEVDKFWATYDADVKRREQEEEELRDLHYEAQEAMAKTLYAPVIMTKLAEPAEFDPRRAAKEEAEARL